MTIRKTVYVNVCWQPWPSQCAPEDEGHKVVVLIFYCLPLECNSGNSDLEDHGKKKR